MQLLSLTMAGAVIMPKKLQAATDVLDYFDEPAKAVHIKKGEGTRGTIGGIDFLTKLHRSQTQGHLASSEATLKPGFMGAPPHMHTTFDEVCFVLEGTVSIMVGETVFEVQAGDWHLRPRNAVHTFWNATDSVARFVDLYIPGGHEDYMEDLAKLFENNGRPKKDDFTLLAQRHDIIYSWELLQGIMTKYKVHL